MDRPPYGKPGRVITHVVHEVAIARVLHVLTLHERRVRIRIISCSDTEAAPRRRRTSPDSVWLASRLCSRHGWDRETPLLMCHGVSSDMGHDSCLQGFCRRVPARSSLREAEAGDRMCPSDYPAPRLGGGPYQQGEPSRWNGEWWPLKDGEPSPPQQASYTDGIVDGTWAGLV